MGRQFVFSLSADDKELESSTKRAQANLGQLGAGASELAGKLNVVSVASAALNRAMDFAGMAAGYYVVRRLATSVIGVGQSIAEAQVNADRMRLSLMATFGADRASREIEFITGLTKQLGLDLNSTSQSYTRFQSAARGTSLEGERARDAFTSVAKAAALMGLSVDETQGVLRALEQMISKGTVQAEELRGQLGDRLPGAMQIAARAMDVTTEKLQQMVQNGEVMAGDFIPKFARQLDSELGGKTEDVAKRMQGALNNLGTSWEMLKRVVAESGVGDFISGQLREISTALDKTALKMALLKAAGAGPWGQAAGGFVEFIRMFHKDLREETGATLDAEIAAAAKEVERLNTAFKNAPKDAYGLKYARIELEYQKTVLADLQRRKAEVYGGKQPVVDIDQAEAEASLPYQKERAEWKARVVKNLTDLTSKLGGVNKEYAASLKAIDEARALDLINDRQALELKTKLYQLEGGGAKVEQQRRAAFELAAAGMRVALDETRASVEEEDDIYRSRVDALRNYRRADLIGDQTYLESLKTASDERIRVLEDAQRKEEAIIRKQMALANTKERADLEKQLVDSSRRYGSAIRNEIRGTSAAYGDADAAAQQYARDMEATNKRTAAELITDSHARARAIVDIETEEQRRRISLYAEGTDARKHAEDALAEWVALRNRKLTEELKPEYQRQLEAWQDSNRLMRETHDDFMRDFVEQGRQAFSDFLETGKVNTRSLAQFIGRTFADLAYKKYLAQSVASLGELIFSSIGNAFGLGGSSSGGAVSQAAGGGSYSLSGMGVKFGERAMGGPVKAGGLYRVNEFDSGGAPGELLSDGGGNQWLMARRDGYVTPGASNAGSGGAGATVIFNMSPNIYAAAGQSPAMVGAAVGSALQAFKAQLMDDLVRHGDFRRAVESY